MDLETGAPLPSRLRVGGGSSDGRRVHGADRYNGGRWKDMAMAYRTLGVVFGGLVTSPLYVYPSMNLKSPTEQDYLGIYGIMFWTLTLIGVVKYVCIALNADDHGEGNMAVFHRGKRPELKA